MDDITVFEPPARAEDYFLEFPELKEYPEFAELSTRELRICYLLGSRTSSLATSKEPQKMRLNRAIKQVYGKLGERRKEVQEMRKGVIPDNIMEGIHAMARFQPSIRLRAKFSSEYIFDKLNEIIEITPEEMGEMDSDSRKKYSELIIKISESLPDMVKRIESGFGIKYKPRKVQKGAEIKASITDT